MPGLEKLFLQFQGLEVKKHSVSDVVDYLLSFKETTKLLILTPFACCEGTSATYQLELFFRQGITRIILNNAVYDIEEILKDNDLIRQTPGNNLVIDRISVSREEESISRYGDSVQIAMSIGKGICSIADENNMVLKQFSDRFVADGIAFEEPSVYMFSFNNPLGHVLSVRDMARSLASMKIWLSQIKVFLYSMMLLLVGKEKK
jgi:excinuclease ABC subunit A